jgi:hypothetical protein
MGHTIWVDVQGRADRELPPDNSIMLRLAEQLDKLSTTLGVPKLSTFHDYSVLEDEYGDLGELGEDDESDGDEGEDAGSEATSADTDGGESRGSWFDPAVALAAVRAIREHLARHPEDLGFEPGRSQAHWPAELMKELIHVDAVLEDAASRNKKFRFLIVP